MLAGALEAAGDGGMVGVRGEVQLRPTGRRVTGVLLCCNVVLGTTSLRQHKYGLCFWLGVTWPSRRGAAAVGRRLVVLEGTSTADVAIPSAFRLVSFSCVAAAAGVALAVPRVLRLVLDQRFLRHGRYRECDAYFAVVLWKLMSAKGVGQGW